MAIGTLASIEKLVYEDKSIRNAKCVANNKDGRMICVICAGSAEKFQSAEGWEEHVCPTCGHYKVSSQLLLYLKEKGQRFDVVQTRRWFERVRASCPYPEITFVNALLMPPAAGACRVNQPADENPYW